MSHMLAAFLYLIDLMSIRYSPLLKHKYLFPNFTFLKGLYLLNLAESLYLACNLQLATLILKGPGIS